MMMSAAMVFWICIECSGVSNISLLSWGDWNFTPSWEGGREGGREVLVLRGNYTLLLEYCIE